MTAHATLVSDLDSTFGRELLLDEYSDAFKACYGMRPRSVPANLNWNMVQSLHNEALANELAGLFDDRLADLMQEQADRQDEDDRAHAALLADLEREPKALAAATRLLGKHRSEATYDSRRTREFHRANRRAARAFIAEQY